MTETLGSGVNKKHGVYAVFAAIAVQLTIGIAYIWSVFQTGVSYSIFGQYNEYGERVADSAAAALTFSLMLATLTIGSVIGGKLAAKYSTRIVIFIGGIIVSAGFFFAAFVTDSFPWALWLTYGVMGGIGMGFQYSTMIVCAQRWYPHRRGLVTGIIVAALGLGGVVFTPAIERLIIVFGGENALETGAGASGTFIVLSAVFLIVSSVGSIFMRTPPEGYMSGSAATGGVAQKAFTSTEMLKTPQFYLIMLTLMLACMGGLMMIAFARPIAIERGISVELAAVGVIAIALFNSVGRLTWGMISDKLGRINTLIILLAGNAVLSLLVNVAGNFIFILVAFIGFFYGGFLSNFPALTADIFGTQHNATNYGFVLLGFGAGAVISSQIAGYYRDIAIYYDDIDRMFPAFVIASACAAAGIIMMFILKSVS